MSLDGYLLSIDQGTTSSRALILDIQGNIISQKNFEFKQYFPNDGWVEHDPIEILKTTQDAINFVIGETNINPKDINIAGITNQRETVVAWNKITGKPVYNAIVWQDRRTENFCETLRENNLIKLIQSKTGLVIDPYFSATKIKWIIENIEEAKKSFRENNLLVGTIDSWLIWNFTKGECHYTDVTNASRTMLYNINEDCWDDELLNIFNINKNILPDVKNCADDFGVIDSSFFGEKISIGGVAGDQQDAEAINRYCEAAVAIDPQSVLSRRMRSQIRMMTGRNAAAIQDLDWLIDNDEQGFAQAEATRLREALIKRQQEQEN